MDENDKISQIGLHELKRKKVNANNLGNDDYDYASDYRNQMTNPEPTTTTTTTPKPKSYTRRITPPRGHWSFGGHQKPRIRTTTTVTPPTTKATTVKPTTTPKPTTSTKPTKGNVMCNNKLKNFETLVTSVFFIKFGMEIWKSYR